MYAFLLFSFLQLKFLPMWFLSAIWSSWLPLTNMKLSMKFRFEETLCGSYHEQEFFGDYYAVNSDVWSLNMPASACISLDHTPPAEPVVDRVVDGLFSLLLSLKVEYPLLFLLTMQDSTLCSCTKVQ